MEDAFDGLEEEETQVRSAMDRKKLKRPARGETPSGAGKKAERGKRPVLLVLLWLQPRER